LAEASNLSQTATREHHNKMMPKRDNQMLSLAM
jgi:hypothetical protein